MHLQHFFGTLSTFQLFVSSFAIHHHVANPTYHSLPSLRDQAIIQDGWLSQRLLNIPSILKKYNVDAWLVSISSPSAQLPRW
jgi:hypothetical protein